LRGLILALGVFIIIGEHISCVPVIEIEANKDVSFISYRVYHFFHSVEGINKHVSCKIDIDSTTDKIIGVSAKAEVDSFDSGNEARDKTAMKAIESDKFPAVAFQSDSIAYDSDTTISVLGKLTFHGVTKKITIPITIVPKTYETICDGSVRLDFDKFNVERPDLLFIPVGNTFIIRFHVVFDWHLQRQEQMRYENKKG